MGEEHVRLFRPLRTEGKEDPKGYGKPDNERLVISEMGERGRPEGYGFKLESK